MATHRVIRDGNHLVFETPHGEYIWPGAGDDWNRGCNFRQMYAQRIGGNPPLRTIIEYIISHEEEISGARHCEQHNVTYPSGHCCPQCVYDARYNEALAAGYTPAEADVEAKLGDGPAG